MSGKAILQRLHTVPQLPQIMYHASGNAYRCLSVFSHLFSSKYAAMHRYGVSRSPMTAWNFF